MFFQDYSCFLFFFVFYRCWTGWLSRQRCRHGWMKSTLKLTWRVIRWDLSWKTHWKPASRWGKFFFSTSCFSYPEWLFVCEYVVGVSFKGPLFVIRVKPASFWLQKMLYMSSAAVNHPSALFGLTQSNECIFSATFMQHEWWTHDSWMCCTECVTVLPSAFSDHTGAGKTANWGSVQHFE